MGAFPVGVIQWATCAVIHVAEEGFNEPACALGMIWDTRERFATILNLKGDPAPFWGREGKRVTKWAEQPYLRMSAVWGGTGK